MEERQPITCPMCGGTRASLIRPPRQHECGDCGEEFDATPTEPAPREPIVNDVGGLVWAVLAMAVAWMIFLTIFRRFGIQ